MALEKLIETKMAFYEIGNGKFAEVIQKDFEKAQLIALERNLTCKIKIEISIHPPVKGEEDYMEISFSHNVVEPKIKSRNFPAIHRDGTIIRDAQIPMEQLSLDLIEDDVTSFKAQQQTN